MNRIREVRKQRKLTMKELGKMVGCAESTICLYETDQRQPDNLMLIQIADALETTVDYLLGREEDNKMVIQADADLAKMIAHFQQLSPQDKQDILSYSAWKLSSHEQ